MALTLDAERPAAAGVPPGADHPLVDAPPRGSGGFTGDEGIVAAQPHVRDLERFTGHRVRLPVFEGPLDLLLYLIRAHRYDIFDIPIREVTSQFLDFVRLMEVLELEYAGDFMVTAATLMQIKSRMLLPPQESENEEEIEEQAGDPRAELVARLIEYQRLQEAADTLREMRDRRAGMFSRPAPLLAALLPEADAPTVEEELPLLLQDVSTFDLLRALRKVLDRVAERPVALVVREPFTVGERLRHLMARVVASRDGITFDDLCDDCQTRLEVVVTFLSLLELMRRARVRVTQRQLFAEIWVSPP